MIRLSSAPESLGACKGRAMLCMHREALTKSCDQERNVSLDFLLVRIPILNDKLPLLGKQAVIK